MKIKMTNRTRLILKTKKNSAYIKRLPYQLYGMIWDINPYDVDDFSSVPHGDSVDRQYKLNVFTGEVFRKRTKKYVGHLSKKDFQRLQDDKDVSDTIEIAKNFSREHFPYRPIKAFGKSGRCVFVSLSDIERE